MLGMFTDAHSFFVPYQKRRWEKKMKAEEEKDWAAHAEKRSSPAALPGGGKLSSH